jgi:hypothetical protein
MSTDWLTGMIATARALAVDGVCAEMVTAFREQGIEPVLLKGATVASWLYERDLRSYGDVDLLVAPERLMDAAGILGEHGFRPGETHVSLHAHPWARPSDGAQVDLHGTLFGCHYSADRVWREIQSSLASTNVAGTDVTALNLAGRALLVTLHAAQHVDEQKPREDLRRALEIATDDIWRDAERLADRVGGLQTMSEGLSLDPDGARLVRRLPLVEAATMADPRDAPIAIGVARLAGARGARAKFAVLLAAVRRPYEDLASERGAATARRFGRPAARAWHVVALALGAPRTLRKLVRFRRSRR